MKKIWSVLVAAALIFTLAACGNSNSNNTGSNEKGTAEFTGSWLEGRRFNENPSEDSIREWVRGLDLE